MFNERLFNSLRYARRWFAEWRTDFNQPSPSQALPTLRQPIVLAGQ